MGSAIKAFSAICLLWIPVHVASAGEPYSIPAHWIEGSDVLEPRDVDFQFTDIAFSSPTDGWIVGQAFFLRITGGDPLLTFVGHHPLFWTVATPSASEAWAGGGEGEVVLWHYSDQTWRPVDLGPLGLQNTSMVKLRFESQTRGWALLSTLPPRSEWGPAPIPSSSFLYFDGTTWTKVPAGSGTNPPRLWDMCVDASGSGWAVGDIPGPGGVILKKEGLTWREVEPPPMPGGAWVLHKVACLSGGGMVCSGVIYPDEAGHDPGEGFLLWYEGSWRRVPLPKPFEKYSPETLTVASSDEIWVFATGSWRDHTFLRFAHGQWSDPPLPTLPGTSTGGVRVNAMQFVSPTEAWAAATKDYGGGVWRGLVFHYKDGAWRNRNWNWHFWRQRWFGLLGH